MIRVGVAGWSYPDWEGIVYPARKSARFDRLAFLAEYFDTIEVNSTFYRIPEAETVAAWVRRVRRNSDFRFTVKLFQGFTHSPEFAPATASSAFKKALEPMASAGLLGAVLVQFPYSFHPVESSRQRLDKILDLFEGYPLVVEMRHAEWASPRFFDYLRNQGVGFCNIDQPQVSRSLGPTEIATSSPGYVRLHGRNEKAWFQREATPAARYDYLYEEKELVPWAERIHRIVQQTPDIFVIANNHYRGKAPLAALTLLSLLTNRAVPVPPDLLAAHPQIKPRAVLRRPAQESLFQD